MAMNAAILKPVIMARVDLELLVDYPGEPEAKTAARDQIEKLVNIISEEVIAHIVGLATVSTAVAPAIVTTCPAGPGTTTSPGSGQGTIS